MTARAVGWDIMRKKLVGTKPSSLVNDPHEDVRQILKTETQLSSRSRRGLLREKTRWNLQKLLKYRDPDAVEGIAERATDHMVREHRPLSCRADCPRPFRTNFWPLRSPTRRFMKKLRLRNLGNFLRDCTPVNLSLGRSDLRFRSHMENLVPHHPWPGARFSQ